MRVKTNLAALKETKWDEYALRFLFGGLITVATGLIAKKFGPGVGGLFLAFPAIFPATATLIARHEKEEKKRAGLDGTSRGRDAAAIEARGTATGAISLLGFGAIAWRLLPAYRPGLILIASATAWVAISIVVWRLQIALRRARLPR
jgi:Protein of unknown function (DUF3147)